VSWIAPKTDWKETYSSDGTYTGDYFNLDPDYNRIKGNIQYVKDYSLKLYADFPLITMQTVTIDEIPLNTFLNNIVNNVTLLETSLYKPPTDQPMKTYTGGLAGWNASDLNIIEGNILKLYNAIVGQWNILNKLSYMMGVDEL